MLHAGFLALQGKHAQITPRAMAIRRPAAPQLRSLSGVAIMDQRPFAARPIARNIASAAAAADPATTEETYQYQAEVSSCPCWSDQLTSRATIGSHVGQGACASQCQWS